MLKTAPVAAPARPLRVALIGSPNSGKTTLFNALTGLNHRVGNFAGVTVDHGKGSFKTPDGRTVELIDLPGINGLAPQSTDEAVTVEFLLAPEHPLHPDQVWIVGDLDGARRSLLLASQVRDLGFPVALIFNRLDHAAEASADALCQKIEELWGVPAVAVSARDGRRVDQLPALLDRAKTAQDASPYFPPDLWTELQAKAQADGQPPYRWYRNAQRHAPDKLPAAFDVAPPAAWLDRELALRLDRIDGQFGLWLERLQKSTQTEQRRTRAIDRWLMHPVFGPVVLVVCLLLVFQALFTVSAVPMDWVDGGMASAADWMKDALPDSWWSRLLVDGVWAGLQGVFVFIPQIALLFALVSFLEESGYMARLASWLDRPMRRLGMGGKAVAPLLGGFACAVPSIMLARGLPDRRQRLLTILLVPFMSCSARLPVYVVLIAVLIPDPQPWLGLDVRAWCMAGALLSGPLIGLLFVQLISHWVGGKRAPASALITELPTYRLPALRDVVSAMIDRSRVFVVEAGRVILAVSIVLWFLSQYGPTERREALAQKHEQELVAFAGDEGQRAELQARHDAQLLESSWAGVLGQSFEPVISPLGYDWRIGVALLTSFAAREVFVGTMNTLFAAGGSEDDDYARLTDRLRNARRADSGTPLFSVACVVSLLLFYALALQCVSTVAVMRRELGGWSLTLAALGWHTGLAWVAAFAAWQLLK